MRDLGTGLRTIYNRLLYLTKDWFFKLDNALNEQGPLEAVNTYLVLSL